MKRTFVAIPVTFDSSFLSYIERVKTQLDGFQLRWAPSSNYHLTLHFHGQTTEDELDRFKTLLQEFCRRRSAFSICLSSLNFFRKGQKPHVLYVGTSEDEPLLTMASALIRDFAACGLANLEQVFNPHVTLARIKEQDNRDRLLKELAELPQAPVQMLPVEQVVIYESVLTPDGPIYTPLHKFQLIR